MNLLSRLLLTMAAIVVVSGSALAKTGDQNSKPGTPLPGGSESYHAFGESRPRTFADFLDLGVGADYQRVTVAASRTPPVDVDDDLLLALAERADATGSVFGADSFSDDPVIDLPTVPAAPAGRLLAAKDRQMGDGYLFSVAAIPEPADWMALLCGFVVVAFIARRKSNVLAD